MGITAKHIPGDAPAGCENWFIIVTAPGNDGQNWNTLVERARRDVISKIQRMLGIDVASLIECEQILTPSEIEERLPQRLWCGVW